MLQCITAPVSAAKRGILKEEEEKMNARVQLHDGVEVCGLFGSEHICVRPPNHWGPHVIRLPDGSFQLHQTVCSPISFEIAQKVAEHAMNDPDWTWGAD